MRAVVVGAGITGLVAARRMMESGAEVTVLDMGEQPGGRIRTRVLGDAVADSGAQSFTARRAPFVGLLSAWRYAGVPVRVWAHGWARATSVASGPPAARYVDDMTPRYSVAGGLGRLIEHVAEGIDVRPATRVVAVRDSRDGIAVEDADGRSWEADAAVVTPALPAAVALLDAGGLDVPDDLRAVRYQPCIAVTVALDGAADVPHPGGVAFEEGPVSWLADNQAKGASEVPALTIHASREWSEAHGDDADGEVAEALLGACSGWLATAAPLRTEVERWVHARPVDPITESARFLPTASGRIVVAGDGFVGVFGGGTIETAAMSGLTAAERVSDA